MKNIALFIDGTNNDGPRDKWRSEDTNVWKLYNLCTEKYTLYQRGVGSGREGALGGAAGFGTKERLKEAYLFLVDNYQPGDNIYLFGFSRGAFAVRILAGFLGYVGTLFGRPEFKDYLPHIYQLYESFVIVDVVQASFVPYLNQLSETERNPLPIHFIGVWDTVERYFPRRDLPEIEQLAPHISHARHALAIHERRTEMAPTLWKTWDAKSSMKQVWFPGAHADIGGGYSQSKVSEASLEWIYSEAKTLGLKLSTPTPRRLNKVLHQQRTDVTFNGGILAALRGEPGREALTALLTKNVLNAMEMHQTAFDHLVGAGFIPDVEFFGRFPDFDKDEALRTLADVDKDAIKLASQLPSGALFQNPKPRPPYRRLN